MCTYIYESLNHVVTIYLHCVTDRQERFDLKISKLKKYCANKNTYILDALEVK